MAKTTLNTDYQNDVLSSAMNGKRKYKMITNSDGTVSFEDVTTYTQTGSDWAAGDINIFAKNINESVGKTEFVGYNGYCSDIATDINFDDFSDSVNLPKTIDNNTEGKLNEFKSGVRRIIFISEETAIVEIIGAIISGVKNTVLEIRVVTKDGTNEILATGTFTNLFN